MNTELPEPSTVGPLAATLLARIEADEAYPRLLISTRKYESCWKSTTGFPMVENWSEETDSYPLITEALRVLALKAAVFDLSGGDEHAAELVISAPVDEMVHAVLAQYTLCTRIAARNGVSLVHMTDQEQFGYDPHEGRGVYTVACYQAAGWGEPDPRYWIGLAETRHRLGVLDSLYASIGFEEFGRAHRIDFSAGRRGNGVPVAAG